MVPHEQVDKVSYLAHPHGIPHDDQLMADMHSLSPIRYGKLAPHTDEGGPALTREKHNDEVTRNLQIMRDAFLKTPNPANPESLTEPVRDQTKELHQRTLKRFARGDYATSKILDRYRRHPELLRHRDSALQDQRLATNPAHHGGQGVRSHHETMRIQNRANFIQSRMLLSQSHMLNPKSGIHMIRHTTMTPEQKGQYDQMINSYVKELFEKKAVK
jgi:hypothetical protein